MPGRWDAFWTSGTDENHNGCWIWAAPVIGPLTYINWAKGEPDNDEANQNCLSIGREDDFQYFDQVCGRDNQFLCKRPTDAKVNTVSSLDQHNISLLC